MCSLPTSFCTKTSFLSVDTGSNHCSLPTSTSSTPYLSSSGSAEILPITTGGMSSNQLIWRGGYTNRRWVSATRRVQHKLVQSADYIYRQLKFEPIYIQSSQVEGRSHYEMLQKAGDRQYQLLMANLLPNYDGQPDVTHDVSPQTMFARGLSHTMEVFQMVRMMSPHQLTQTKVARELSQRGGKDLQGDEERRQEEKETTQLRNTAHVHSATC